VHPGQYDLLVTGGQPGLHLAQDLVRETAPLRAPGDMNNAVGAGIVAAILDLDQGTGPAWGNIKCGTHIGRRKRANRLLLSGYPFPELLLLLVAGDELDPRQVEESARSQLGVAAGRYQASLRVFAVQAAQRLARFLGCDVGDGAGIAFYHREKPVYRVWIELAPARRKWYNVRAGATFEPGLM
jgi:hypothetical protein